MVFLTFSRLAIDKVSKDIDLFHFYFLKKAEKYSIHRYDKITFLITGF